MDLMMIAIISFCLFLLVLMFFWQKQMGFGRGLLAIICRFGWTLPILCAFFPAMLTQPLPKSVTLKPIHILLDDSASMNQHAVDKSVTKLQQAEHHLDFIKDQCQRLGCAAKITLLSNLSDDVKNGFSPLRTVLESWLLRIVNEPWVLLSDGGDYMPTLPWDAALQGMGNAPKVGGEPLGLIIPMLGHEPINVWIDNVEVAPFSFEGSGFEAQILIGRSSSNKQPERVQLQVAAGSNIVTSADIQFAADQFESTVTAFIPPLPKGQHLLNFKILPTGEETILWDNEINQQIEVMPNTVGVLHLLGSPSWDGRFLRRYLKSEPKYDLISFFILRDPWDSQNISERELSLIPFPVDRLFREELPNFRVVVIQNFALFQFLQTEYQENLVEFIKQGGGLLFIGGPRALQSGDVAGSPLANILPFHVNTTTSSQGNNSMFGLPRFLQEGSLDKNGPYYDIDLSFKIEMATPEYNARNLANVYDDWLGLGDQLVSLQNLKGLHHMEKVNFKAGEYTPLLSANADGQSIPLVVASYPDKGRALWVFTDSLWRTAMAPSPEIARQTYHKFMHSALQWLLRQELKKPLIAKNFYLTPLKNHGIEWQLSLFGPAMKYFKPDSAWKIAICGQQVTFDQIATHEQAENKWLFWGKLETSLANVQRCDFEMSGFHPAFGSVMVKITAMVPSQFDDKQMSQSFNKLNKLAQLTGARLIEQSADTTSKQDHINRWLEGVTGTEGIALPERYKTVREFYWVFDHPWIWLLILCLPLEVIVRRWHKIIGGRLSR